MTIQLFLEEDCTTTKKGKEKKMTRHEKGWKKRMDKINNN